MPEQGIRTAARSRHSRRLVRYSSLRWNRPSGRPNSTGVLPEALSRVTDRRSMEQRMLFRRISRVLRSLGEVTSRASTAVAVASVLLIFIIVLAARGFPSRWMTIFSAIAEVITLVMLFVIQHTQSRHQLVLQLKLDELIRSSPQADDRAVKLEVATDEELSEREQDQLAHHESLREPDSEQ